MKTLSILLLSILLLCGCQANQQPSSLTTEGEVIITGTIKNRDFYPHVEELVLKLPFFEEGQTSYTTPIAPDNSFHFNFRLTADMCEVNIKPYIEHLYVQPGDSIHLDIDFKDMLNPVITGSGAERNKQITQFTEGGFYLPRYSLWNEFQTQEEFDQALEKAYQERLGRYEEYVQKYQPSDEVKQYIADVLKADYYQALFFHLNQFAYNQNKEIDIHRYTDRLQEASHLVDNRTITGTFFGMAELMYNYLHLLNDRFWKGDKSLTLAEVMEPLKDTPAIPYIFARGMSLSLNKLNDTTYFDKEKANFDRYIQSPYLRSSILRIHQSKKNFQENPKPVSDYILYGRYQDQVKAQENLAYMQPFYNLLKKHQGKMIYLDFWTPWCPPCLAEMEPLKELRKKYSADDIVFISICRGDNRKRHEEILNKYGMHVPGIEHILTDDLQEDTQVHQMYNQLNVDAFPFFYIINREGVIVNYGTMLRPSYPGTAECIEKWLE